MEKTKPKIISNDSQGGRASAFEVVREELSEAEMEFILQVWIGILESKDFSIRLSATAEIGKTVLGPEFDMDRIKQLSRAINKDMEKNCSDATDEAKQIKARIKHLVLYFGKQNDLRYMSYRGLIWSDDEEEGEGGLPLRSLSGVDQEREIGPGCESANSVKEKKMVRPHFAAPIRQHALDSSENSVEKKPLRREMSPAQPFPVDALGDRLGRAVRAIEDLTQAPDAVCAQSVLAATSLAVQGHRNVDLDGRVKPLCLFFLTIAESGERKTSADDLCHVATRQREEELRKEGM